MSQVCGDSISSEEIFQSRLASWTSHYNNILRDSDNIEFGSVAYYRLWDPVWAKFIELEKARIAGGWTRPPWYDRMEKERRAYEDSSGWKSTSSTLTSDDWPQVPLGTILENYLSSPVCPDQNDMARALERWQKFGEVITQEHEFERSLSYPQRVSWTLLTHWWSAMYQDSSLSRAAIARLEAAKANPDKVEYIQDEPHLGNEEFLQSRNSLYNSAMYTLFNKEFNPYSWSNHFKAIHLMALKQIREKSNELAAAQRFAYSSYAKMKHFDVQDAGSYTASPEMPCQWLSGKDHEKQYPYFLWDVQREQTVIVDELPIKPEYCCVSHTWGRWRLEKVPIKGVPWHVPRNKRFEIESLPQQLRRLKMQAPFVWIDLFCIPQDRSPKAAEEINRQAIIFQNASHCIAWMNDMTGWTKTLQALDWIGVSFLHATTVPGVYETEKLLHPLYKGAQEDSEMFTQVVDLAAGETCERNPQQIAISSNKLAEPACWFSSLWTLQEAMLCSNLTFVNRDWKPLEDGLGTPIPLDGLFRILSTLQYVWDNDKPYENWVKGYIVNY